MEEEPTREQKIKALRESLANGRRASTATVEAGTADRGTEGDGPDTHPPSGAEFEAFQGNFGRSDARYRGDSEAQREPEPDQRSPLKILKRERPGARRSSTRDAKPAGNSSPSAETSSATSARVAGGLETDEPVPQRKPEASFTPETEKPAAKERKRPVRSSKSEGGKGSPFPWLKTTGPLTKQEAEEYYEPLKAALIDFGGYTNEGLKLGCEVEQCVIWDFDDEEADTIARSMLRWGRSSPNAAKAVRGMVYSADYIELGIIFIPRIVYTANLMHESPRAKKARAKREAKKQK